MHDSERIAREKASETREELEEEKEKYGESTSGSVVARPRRMLVWQVSHRI